MALLAVVATILVGVHTPVLCSPPGHWVGAEAGFTYWPQGRGGPARIYLRQCKKTVAGIRMYVDVFAHELLHVEHPWWTHPHVYRAQHSYGKIVLAEIRRQK